MFTPEETKILHMIAKAIDPDVVPDESTPYEPGSRVLSLILKAIKNSDDGSDDDGDGGDDSGDGGHDEDPMLNTPLTFEAKADGTKIYFLSHSSEEHTCSIDVSTDNGQTWTEVTSETYSDGNNTPIATLDTGEKMLVRGDNPNGLSYYSQLTDDKESGGSFYVDGEAFVCGNVMSLLSKNDFQSMTDVPDYAFTFLFGELDWKWKNDTSLFSHPTNKILLPATTLGEGCYYAMFSGCSNLTIAPELPAVTMKDNCYQFMLQACGMTKAPELPATTLAAFCYANMFDSCTNLVEAPELPATTLAVGCYASMFNECTSLVEAPELSAKALVSDCYDGMFSSCTNLNYIKALFTTTPELQYTGGWVNDVSATGTFIKNEEATWDVTGINGIPTGWTVETA